MPTVNSYSDVTSYTSLDHQDDSFRIKNKKNTYKIIQSTNPYISSRNPVLANQSSINNWVANPKYLFAAKITFDIPTSNEKSFNNIAAFFEKLSSHLRDLDKNATVGEIYSFVSPLLINNKFELCDLLLKKVEEKKYPTWALMPFLTLTKPFKNTLKNRGGVLALLSLSIIDDMSKEEAKLTLQRLI
ncbi:MAG: hypothetical protein ACPGLV_00490 [Bacteroidia bacterium]